MVVRKLDLLTNDPFQTGPEKSNFRSFFARFDRLYRTICRSFGCKQSRSLHPSIEEIRPGTSRLRIFIGAVPFAGAVFELPHFRCA